MRPATALSADSLSWRCLYDLTEYIAKCRGAQECCLDPLSNAPVSAGCQSRNVIEKEGLSGRPLDIGIAPTTDHGGFRLGRKDRNIASEGLQHPLANIIQGLFQMASDHSAVALTTRQGLVTSSRLGVVAGDPADDGSNDLNGGEEERRILALANIKVKVRSSGSAPAPRDV